MSLENIYRIEDAIEAASASVLLNSFGVKAYSPLDAPKFQKVRPRTEIFSRIGPGMNRWSAVYTGPAIPAAQLQAAGLTAAQIAHWPLIQTVTPAVLALLPSFANNTNPSTALEFYKRETAWQFTITFQVITDDDINIHSAYRSQVRGYIAALNSLINNYIDPQGNSVMPYHAVMLRKDNGSTERMIQPEQALMRTDLVFEGAVSIQANAWAELLTQPNQQ